MNKTGGLGRYGFILWTIVFLFSGPTVFGSTPGDITSCQALDTAGVYTLNTNVSSFETCFNITSSHVTLDCQGNNITYNTAGVAFSRGIDASWQLLDNLTIKNCFIYKGAPTSNSGYGISSYITNSKIVNNTISNGAVANRGIYLLNYSQNNIVGNNTIYTKGTVARNIGLFLGNSTSNNALTDNTIVTDGSRLNHGIFLGVLASNNLISGNNITTDGTFDNYGIYLDGSTNNILANNSIQPYSDGSGFGIHLQSASHNNTISKNTIITNRDEGGARGTGHGVYLTSSSSFNRVLDNTILAGGLRSEGIFLENNASSNTLHGNNITTEKLFGSRGFGIHIVESSSNNVTDNVVTTGGPVGSAAPTLNHGIFLSGYLTTKTLVSNNTILTGGLDGENHGVYLYNTSENTISDNTIFTNGTTKNYGVAFDLADRNFITRNTIHTGGLSDNHAFYNTLNSSLNTISYNSIFTSGVGSDAFRWGSNITNSTNNTNSVHKEQNNITSNILKEISGYDLAIYREGMNGTRIVDQMIGDYLFTGHGNIITFVDTRFGEIQFIKAITGFGSNLSHDVNIGNNSVAINLGENLGLNKSANVTLYGLPTTLGEPIILKDGVECSPADCYNFTSLNAGTVVFNVTSWSNYSISDLIKPKVTINSPQATTIYSISSFPIDIDLSEYGFCTYSIDGGLTQEGLTREGNKFTGTSPSRGTGRHPFNVYCNDTAGNTNSTEGFNVTINIPSTEGGGGGGGGGASLPGVFGPVLPPAVPEGTLTPQEETSENVEATEVSTPSPTPESTGTTATSEGNLLTGAATAETGASDSSFITGAVTGVRKVAAKPAARAVAVVLAMAAVTLVVHQVYKKRMKK